MIRRILHVARREWLENTRQPAMIATMGGLLLVVCALALWQLSVLDGLAEDAVQSRAFAFWSRVAGLSLEDPVHDLAALCVYVLDYLTFSQLLGMTAVIAGHVGIHDRLCGTSPFLLLAPIRRGELVAGKILGALALPFVLYALIGGTSCAIAASFPVAEGMSAYLPPAAGWWFAFVVAGPAWTVFVGTLCVVISTRARDVRTAQQASWFLVFFATLALSPLVVNAMDWGLTAQLVLTGIGALLTVLTMAIAAAWMGRS